MENICKNSSIKSAIVPPSGMTSKKAERAPKNIETAPKVKATGYPTTSRTRAATNMIRPIKIELLEDLSF